MYTNKTVIITGAASGMGRAMAQAFLDAGANVVVNARKAEDFIEFLADNTERHAQIKTVIGDIGHQSTGQALAQAALDTFGTIDVLINNAGAFVPKPFLEETEANLDAYYATTVKGSYFSAQAVIPTMQTQQDGVIINIGSMWVENPLEATPASASQVMKGAMHTLTRHLAIEFAKDNIRVNTIAPAIIETPLYDNLMDKEALAGLAKLHPLRKLGNLDDIIAWAKHLSGQGGRFVTGQTHFVDGGINSGSHLV